jgi:hypothetical protein
MKSRLIILIAFACCIATVRAVDIYKLPPMDDFEWPKIVELKGRDVEAMDVALQQFRENNFSSSGDLKHFTIEVRRHRDKLAVAFTPESDEPSHRITPARNKYGTWITYFVSLRTLKIVGYHFERD